MKAGSHLNRKANKLPEWAQRIFGLRQRLGLSQAALGDRLNYSAMAVSRWERGAIEPPAQGYIALGNLAGDPDCRWFWSRAGLRSADISRLLAQGPAKPVEHFPPFRIVLAGSGKKKPKRSARIEMELVAVPLLSAHAATRGEVGDQHADLQQVPAEAVIATPALWLPNPNETSCLRVRGSSMAPLIQDGDIIAVDSSQNDPGLLSGKIIVALHRDHGLSLGRFLMVDGTQILESENREYQPIVFGKDRKWRIIGKVLWWIRQAP